LYDPRTGEVGSNNDDDNIAGWFVDTDYDGKSFFHACFTGANEPYESGDEVPKVHEARQHRTHLVRPRRTVKQPPFRIGWHPGGSRRLVTTFRSAADRTKSFTGFPHRTV
jgi:adenine-specific DNA-methyltransferase